MTTASVTPEVAIAIEELEATFPDCHVVVRADGEGGCWVVIEGVPLGPPHAQSDTWLGFRITFQYPNADVYPLFVRNDLSRLDGAPLGEGMSMNTFDGRPAVQVSRKSNHLDPRVDTAVGKVLKVLLWLQR